MNVAIPLWGWVVVVLAAVVLVDGLYIIRTGQWHKPWIRPLEQAHMKVRPGRPARLFGLSVVMWALSGVAAVLSTEPTSTGAFFGLVWMVLTGFAIVLLAVVFHMQSEGAR
jgi:hypothetical protein